MIDEAAQDMDAWTGWTFVETVNEPPPEWKLYKGEGEEDVMDDLGMADVI